MRVARTLMTVINTDVFMYLLASSSAATIQDLKSAVGLRNAFA